MQTIKTFLDQSQAIWKESTAAARFGLILLLTICVGAVVGVGIWSTQPNYVTVADNLEFDKSAQLTTALDQANIGYEIKGSGSIIQVDERSLGRARVLAGKLGIGSDEAELETASPWMDPVSQQNVFRRNLERQLASSIEKTLGIESATVHLNLPERQPFLRQSEEPTASVVLEISPKHRFNETQAATIAQTIAHAAGIPVANVAISDTAGNLFSNSEDLGRLTKQEEYRLNRERELTGKAQAMLVNFLGIGNAHVEVTTDFTFPNGTKTSTIYDPDKKVATSEKNESTVSSSGTEAGRANSSAAGVAGASNNAGAGRGGENGKSVTSKTETLNSEFQVSSTIEEDTVSTPILNLLTVSVLVNTSKVQNESKEIPANVKTSIESMVKQAVGFRPDSDQFTLEFFEFVELLPTEETPASAIPWEQINSVLKNISLGIAAVVALFLGLKVIRKLQPSPALVNSGAVLTGARNSQVNQLSDMVKQNPEVFSKIIAAWANDSPSDGSEKLKEKAA